MNSQITIIRHPSTIISGIERILKRIEKGSFKELLNEKNNIKDATLNNV